MRLINNRPALLPVAVALLIVSTCLTACGADQVLRADPTRLTQEAARYPTNTPPRTVGQMRLASRAFRNSGQIPQKYTCDGAEVSPPLGIANVPGRAESLALVVRDLDGPEVEFAQWIVWNIPVETKQIPEGSLPQGAVEGRNGLNTNSYAAPCPGSGRHRYEFDLYALDTVLDLPRSAGKAQLLGEIETHFIAQARLTGIVGEELTPTTNPP